MGTRWLLIAISVVVVAIGLVRTSDVQPDVVATTQTTTIEPAARPAAFANPLRDPRIALVMPAGALRLEGLVVDAQQQPVAGARVSLGGGHETTTTEADGSFAFDGLAEGTYALAAEQGEAYAEEHDARLREDSEPVTLELRVGANLTVRVIDRDTRAPIAGATVETRDRSALTDPRGIATLRAIDAGHERLEITAPGHAQVTTSVTTDEPVALERTIELAAGAPASGEVQGPDGAPVPDAIVWVTAATGDTRHRVQADEHGRWSVALLPAGQHAIQASSERYVELPEALFETDGVHPRDRIIVRVDLGVTVRGLVVDGKHQPVADASVGVTGGRAQTDAHGRFVIEGVAPGELELSATTSLGISETQRLTATRGQVIEARLVVVASSLAGIVLDDEGLPADNVTVTARDPKHERLRYASTDDFGKFDFGGIEPGEYELRATHDGAKQRDDEPALRVATGRRDLRLTVASLGGLRGRVVQDGRPVARFGVMVTSDPDVTYLDLDATSTRDGRFERSRIGPGTWWVVLVGPTFERLQRGPFTLQRGQMLELGDLAVERGRVITGRVVDERGLPVAGAVVGISPSSGDDLDDLRLSGALRGRIYTRTGNDGRYTLIGVPREDSQYVRAAHPAAGRSIEREVATSDAVVDLVVLRTGSLGGAVVRLDAHQQAVDVYRGGENIARAPLDHAGLFRVDGLPAGRYEVRLRGSNTLPTQEVEVLADRVAPVVFELPAQPITLAVRAPGCRYLKLVRADTNLLFEACTNGAAELTGITPGGYEVCVDGECVAIELAPQPARQQLVIPPTP